MVIVPVLFRFSQISISILFILKTCGNNHPRYLSNIQNALTIRVNTKLITFLTLHKWIKVINNPLC